MKVIDGIFNNAIVFTDNIEDEATAQIARLCGQEFTKGSKIRIMPDVHAGAGCTIGTTMTITDKVVPNLVGVDIGCGMEVARLDVHDIDFGRLDRIIKDYVPSGFEVRQEAHIFIKNIDLGELICIHHVNLERAVLSVGTLGGGNHFIEVDTDGESLYLVVHSGSRNLGKQVADYYQNTAFKILSSNKIRNQEIIETLKKEGRYGEIQTELMKQKTPPVNKELAYLEGKVADDYLHDMKIVQHYADLNRKAIVFEICEHAGLKIADSFTTAHNYIDMDSRILRKGSVSARAGERLIIPMNMRDGSLLCTGKGNPDWNFSAPHGAGRLMSRTEAKRKISMDDFESSMKSVWTSSVSEQTLDEAPQAYKPTDEIMRNIADTVTIDSVIKPLYNFKAQDND